MNTSYLNASQKIKDTIPLAGDAGNRSYSRVQFEGIDQDFILCNYPEKDIEQLHNFLDVHNLFSNNSVRVPKVIEASENQMLLEDLGDSSLEDDFKAERNSYLEALEQLVHIQNIPTHGNSKAQSFSFTVEKFVWEMNFTLTHFSKLLDISLDERETKLLQKDFLDLCTHLCSLKQVITHRDYHSRNIMIHKGLAYVIDFQDARIGPKFYDLVSLIEDSYTDLSFSKKQDLINKYCKMTDTVCDDSFMNNYHFQNLQRSFKACGSFASFKNRTNNERYLKYLKPALKSLEHSCESVSGYGFLKSFIKLSTKKWDAYGS